MSSPYLHALTCSKCGASLNPGSGSQILVCPYCQTSHVFAPPTAPESPPLLTSSIGAGRSTAVILLSIAGVLLLGVLGFALAVRAASTNGEAVTSPATDEGPGNEHLAYAGEQPVDIWYGGTWYPGRVKQVDGKGYLVTYDGWSASWNEWVTARRLRPRSPVVTEERAPKAPSADDARTAEKAADGPGDPSATYTSGQSVDIHWGSRWWPGRVLKQEGQRYRIHYDGYASSWDEWVTADRLRPRDAR